MNFRETLKVKIDTLPSGRPSGIGSYQYIRTQEDLASGDVKIVEQDDCVSLGEMCKIIDTFTSGSVETRKLAIRAFLEKDRYEHIEEY